MVELADLINDLREELNRAVTSANPDGLRFALGPVELEVTVAVTKEARPGAKVKFLVVEAGVDTSMSRTATQKIVLTLQPRLAGSDAPAYVSGGSVEDES
jgi:hypothetical protein